MIENNLTTAIFIVLAYTFTIAYFIRTSIASEYERTLDEIEKIANNAIDGIYATRSTDYSAGMSCIGNYILDEIDKLRSDNDFWTVHQSNYKESCMQILGA